MPVRRLISKNTDTLIINMIKNLLLTLALLLSLSQADIDGALQVTINGQPREVYLVSRGNAGSHIKIQGDTVHIIGGGNAFVAKEPRQDFVPNMYEDFGLLGHVLEYTVDMSKVWCSCNAALYFLKMPGYDAEQQPAISDWGNYYCDADEVGGTFCPDMDVAEANRFTFASTAHKCDPPTGKHYTSCDKVGCGANIYNIGENVMCPEDSCIINTELPYTHKVAFHENEEGVLAKIENTVS